MNVSIIIPCYNSEKTIKQCLDALMKSKLKAFQIILVDDASTDNSVDIANTDDIEIIRLNKRSGPAIARNIGVKHAKGDIILFIDSDVVVPEDAISTVIKKFNTRDIQAVQGVYSLKQKYENRISQYQQSYYCYQFLSIKNNYVGIFNTFFCAIKKNIFDKLGGFNEKIPRASAEDTEFGHLIVKKGYKIYLDKTIQVKHLVDYTLLSFIKRKFYIAKDIMKSYLRTKKNKIDFQKNIHNNFSARISIILAPIILINLFLLKYSFFRYTFFLVLALFLIANLRLWIFIYKNGKYLFSSIFLTYLDKLVLFIGVISAYIEFFILNRKF